MKTLKQLAAIVIVLITFLPITTQLFAQVEISGDARIRPRWDIDDKTDVGGTRKDDFYVMYRTRLRIKAAIGDGWMFKSTLAHNGVGEYAGKFATGEYPDILGSNNTTASNESARRATVDFMELFIARETDTYGYTFGLFGISSFRNPIYDVHYYSKRLIDIPFFIFNNDAIYGAKGFLKKGKSRWDAYFFLDDNLGNKLEDAEGNEISNTNDQFTFGLSHTYSFKRFNLETRFLKTVGDSIPAPFTAAITAKDFKVGKAKFGLAAIYSKQSVSDFTDSRYVAGSNYLEYDAKFIRLSYLHPVKSGQFDIWFDLAKRTDKTVAGDLDYNYWYTWISYAHTLYKSDKGSVSFGPNFRYGSFQKETNTSSDSFDVYRSRYKIEIELNIKF